MKRLLSFLLLILVLKTMNAQVYEKKTVQPGHNLSDYYYYLNPSFIDATVKMKNGSQLISKMNFNLLTCQMQFIDPQGDTLNVAKPGNVDSIQLGGSSFFYHNGYYEISPNLGSVRLAVLRTAIYEPLKIGAMGLPVHGTSIETFATFTNESTSKKLIINEQVDVTQEIKYFLISSTGEIVTASKSNFLTLFTKNKKNIEPYLKLNKTNFTKEPDLKKLLDFCNKQY